MKLCSWCGREFTPRLRKLRGTSKYCRTGCAEASLRSTREESAMHRELHRGDCSVPGCQKPVEAAGLCAAHRKRKVRKKVVDGEVRERAETPYQGLRIAAVRLGNADTSSTSDADHLRLEEAFREALRLYLSSYVPQLLNRQDFSPLARVEVERFSKKYAVSRY